MRALRWLPLAVLALGGTANAELKGSASPGANGTLMLCHSGAQSSHTGDTSETILATCTIPAGEMSATGMLRINAVYTFTNNADTKTIRMRLGGIGGTQYLSIVETTNVSFRLYNYEIYERGATNSQVGGSVAGAATGAIQTSAIDMTAAQTLVFTGQLGTGTDTVSLEAYSVELLPQ